MTEPFGHEKLIVYQKGMRFAVLRGASLVDLATAGGVADVARAEAGRERLRRIAGVFTALSKVAPHA